MFPVGKVVGGTRLAKAYDRYFRSVLGSHIEQCEAEYTQVCTKNGVRDRKKPDKFLIKKPLPNRAEYDVWRTEKFTTTVGDIIDEAESTIETLADEMRGWHDNLPENLQDADKGQTISETADTLEGISMPDVPDDVREVSCVYLPSLDSKSRADQAGDAASMLRCAADAIREYFEDHEEDDDSSDPLDQVADELEGCEFPGMY